MERALTVLARALRYGIVFLLGACLGTGLDEVWTGTEPSDLRRAAYRLASEHVEPSEPGELLAAGVRGMLDHLQETDRYASYLPPADASALMEETRGEIGGIGVSIGSRQGPLRIVDVFPGTPAARAGIRAGDLVVAVAGVRIPDDEPVESVLGRVKGEPGTQVLLEVEREGHEGTLSFTVRRETIVVPAVDGTRMLEGGIGYTRLRTMSDHAAGHLASAIADLARQGMRGLLLDLRGNLGGTLEAGIDVSDLFLPSGAILRIRPRPPQDEVVFEAASGGEAVGPGLPILVLVDGGTASAAEIVAGALQDHRRARLLGEPTYGKGAVQKVVDVGEEGAKMRYTTAYWYTPSGRRLERHEREDGTAEGGLTPDVEAPFVPDPEHPDRDNVLEQARALLASETADR